MTQAQEEEILRIMKQEFAYFWLEMRETLSENYVAVLTDAELQALTTGRGSSNLRNARRKLKAAEPRILRALKPNIEKFKERALERILSSDLFQDDFQQSI